MLTKLLRSIRKLFANPLVIIIPLMILLVVGWRWYVATSTQGLAMPVDSLLPGSAFTQFDADGVPVGWRLQTHAQANHSVSHGKGYVSDTAFTVAVTNYRSGDITLESAKTKLQPGTLYFYKNFYRATGEFELLARYHYADGTTRLNIVDRYPPATDTWATASAPIETNDQLQAVEFVYRLYSNNTLTLDGAMLQQKTPDSLYIPAPALPGKNLVPNGDFSARAGDQPKDWSSYRQGDNKATFAYMQEGDKTYVRAQVSDYKNGEAKWQYAPQPVQPNQYFQASLDYQSDAPADLVAEFLLANGKHQFTTLTTLKPASDWTHYQTTFEVPPDAQSMFVTAVLHGNGTLSTDTVTLVDITKPGDRQFRQPLLSLTFDDGWESDYLSGAPQLEKYGYQGTFYVNSHTIDKDDFMDQSQLADLLRRGHEVAAHGYDHLDMTTLSSSALNYQLETSSEDIQRFTGIASPNFAAPYGKDDAQTMALTRKYFKSYRGTEDGINTRQNFDPYRLRVLYLTEGTSIDTIRRTLNDTKATKGWLILVYHQVEESQRSTKIAPAIFAAHLEAIKQSGIAVRTVHDALAEVGP